MSRPSRAVLIAAALAVTSLLANRASADCVTNNDGSTTCSSAPNCTTTCSRQYTSAPFLYRDPNDRCVYQCYYTDTHTDSCNGTFMSTGSFMVAAGPWTTDYCEPAVNPPYFCSYFVAGCQ
jgi:hypothetical protein